MRLLGAAALCITVVLACGPRATWAQEWQSFRAGNSQPELARLEIQMWRLINRDRTASSQMDETKGRAHLLTWDDRLAAAARAHSEEMAREGFFSHQGADGSQPAWRVSAAGVAWVSTGENIAKAMDVTQAEAMFMSEPRFDRNNHRGNILNTNYTRVGVGIAKGSDGFFYITQEFAQVH